MPVWKPQFQKQGMGMGKGKGIGKGDTSKLVWVGNLSPSTDYPSLLAVANEYGNARWAEVFAKGTGVIGFATSEEAQSAAAILNGAEVDGAHIVADAWEKKGTDGSGDGWKPQQKSGGWKPQQQSGGWKQGAMMPANQVWGQNQGWGKGKGKGKRIEDTTKLVWVGSLGEGATYQELLAVAREFGNAKWAEVRGKGTGVLGYGSADEAAAAVEQLSGAIVSGSPIISDVWQGKSL